MAKPIKDAASTHKSRPRFGSNAIRLSVWEWVGVVVVLLLVSFLAPRAWERVEPFNPKPDYRIPYALSDDYWHFARYCRYAAGQDAVLVIGDSVVWGEYVAANEALSQCLGDANALRRFINLGVNGIHPMALAGLVDYYGRAVRGRDVLLQYNPLWMSSKRHDLQTEKEFRFNHPKLVPQFFQKIPCYKDPYAERCGAVAERYLPLLAWTNHLSVAYFENTGLAQWTLDNPYADPVSAISLELPEPASSRHPDAKAWFDRGISPQAFDWVGADESLQWNAFCRAVDTLRGRGNRVFVLVGPFNEHMIAQESIEMYREILRAIDEWLTQHGVPHWIAPVLPTELYADASHPVAEGYALLAERMMAHEPFAVFANDRAPGVHLARAVSPCRLLR
ncbi:MAG: hypothetical protein GWP08_10100 [Nitrospiraceae bacterium]|nr:hypothetical protein [Nitrospiraceae bacterium]